MAATETATDVLAAVRELAPSIRARADEIEAVRELPEDLFEQLKAAGVFRLLTPRSHGGLEAGLMASIDVLEELAIADGATGWTTMIGMESPQMSSLLPRATYDALYADGPDVTIGGSFAPIGKAVPAEGGYTISGRWPFASGLQRWDWVLANCQIYDDPEGPPRLGPAGEPITRGGVFPRDAATIEDTWFTLGLRGTGSHHFSVTDQFVPEDYTLDIFMSRPCVEGVARYPIIDFHYHITTIGLGIAQAAMRDVVEAATQRMRMSMRATLAQTPVVQYKLARAAESLAAARTYLRANAARAARTMAEGSEDFLTMMIWVYASNAWIMSTCVEVVDACYTIHGAAGVYDGTPLQRHLRDIHTISQHASVNENSITRAGAKMLGQEVGPWF